MVKLLGIFFLVGFNYKCAKVVSGKVKLGLEFLSSGVGGSALKRTSISKEQREFVSQSERCWLAERGLEVSSHFITFMAVNGGVCTCLIVI